MIRVHTLGGLAVRGGDGKPVVGSGAQPRRMAILALLARAGERGTSRDRILGLLWPDADDERGARSLTQAIYALRKDLSTEEVITGAKELRLEPGLASSDVTEFASAVSRGDDARAVALYDGPFLDGFHLAGAEEFSRWADRERAAIAQDYMRSLESLARAALARGDAAAAVGWWRKVTALEPLNARLTMGLMNALVAAGERAGAIKQAHLYQLLVEQELDLPADRDVTVLAERLRAESESPAAVPVPAVVPVPTIVAAVENPVAEVTATPEPVAPTPVDSPAPAVVITAPATRPRRRPTRAASVGLVAILAGVAVFAALRAGRSGVTANTPDDAVIAVGQIAGYGSDSAASTLAGPVSDLLATSLARVPGLRVVSRGRLLELMRGAQASGGVADTNQGGFVNAARRASATQIIDGTVYARPDGRLRLDLRRVDLASGAISDAHTVEGSDLFALVDSGTARLVGALGARERPGSVADVTTRSVAAYRMYEQGVRAFYRGDSRTALLFFNAALAEDSMFAFATYQSALASVAAQPESVGVRLDRAMRLGARASDRERLTILAGWSHAISSPALRQVAETLVTRYPTEVEGYLYTGIARVYGGDFLGGVAPLERVIAMDSLGGRGLGASCRSCEALRWLVSAYELADSFPAAERVARRWLRFQPGSVPATNALTEVLEARGRPLEADSVFHSATPSDPTYDDVLPFRAMHLIRAGDYETADRLLVAETKQPGAARQMEAYWQLAVSLRSQGRLAEALEAARHVRPLARQVVRRGSPLSMTILEAQIQLEQRHGMVAAALFDSIAAATARDSEPSRPTARGSAWMLTHSANGHAVAGDTATLARLADSVRVLGESSGYGRDRRLYHHIRGLLLTARGDEPGAIAEFQAAIYSLTGGYSRTAYELGALLLRQHRPREAIAVLQPAFRGSLDAANLYMTRPQLHELLGRAWEAASVNDSAAAHYAVVAKAWSAGDAPFRARTDSARARLVTLGATPH
jgi:DNA-binding SARP family transcriptional activator/tetratricopeptide (TPR) repeat protein/TolB-like protein